MAYIFFKENILAYIVIRYLIDPLKKTSSTNVSYKHIRYPLIYPLYATMDQTVPKYVFILKINKHALSQ